MRFSELIHNLQGARVVNAAEAEITGISYDSRDVAPGHVFFAMKGGSHDGHRFIQAALASGAAAVVCEHETPEAVSAGVPLVVVPDGRTAMGPVAARLHNYPSRALTLVGVTGTSGKTTVTHLIQSVFKASGADAGLIGTLGARIGDQLIDTKHTTPESANIQRLLRQMLDHGVNAVAMEVSSHGLRQGRVLGCEFDCGVFTNIARDHLDFHGTAEAYLDAKLMLFRDYPAMSDKKFTAVVNADDPAADTVTKAARGNTVTFGVESPADFAASNISVTDRSVEFDMSVAGQTVPVRLAIGGFFNVYNALAASTAACACGVDIDAVVRGLASTKCVPGRFESVECGQDFGVLVDYAHTPDELENVLRAAKELAKNRLIAVFGCGGDRDRGKRPIMGEIGARLADMVIVTSDNPRTEDPRSIIDQIVAGIPDADGAKVAVEIDRREAIRAAVSAAKPGDVVVIAGKGHEDYQIFADRTIHFDDREVARKALMEAT